MNNQDFFTVPPLAEDEPIKEKKPVSAYRVKLADVVLEYPILKQGDSLLCSRQNISVIKAPAKSAKTFLTSILMSSFLGNTSFELSTPVENGIILCIDTEQSNSTVLKCLKRVHTISGKCDESENLIFLSVNEMGAAELVEFLQDAIDFYKPDLVVLDGTIDLVSNFNDIEESTNVVTLIRQLAIKYNCHILNVLHEGKTNNELRGHLGAFIKNKCETVFQLKKVGDVVTVSPDATRHKPFTEWSFLIDERGLPVYNGEVIPVPKETKTKLDPIKVDSHTHEMILKKVFEIAPEQRYKELYENIQERYAKITNKTMGVSKAKEFLTFYKNNEYLIVVQKGNNVIYKCARLVMDSVG
jgi:hypothetical protein